MVVRTELRDPPPMQPDPAVDRFDGRIAELRHEGQHHGFVLFHVTVWADSSGPLWRRRRGAPYKVLEFAAAMSPESPWQWLEGLDDAEVSEQQLAGGQLEVSDELSFELVWLAEAKAAPVRRDRFAQQARG